MTIGFDLRPGSIRTTDFPPTYESTYVAKGMFASAAVNALARSLTTPLIVFNGRILYRQDIEVVERGFKVWDVHVPYAMTKRELGEFTFEFTTTGGAFHITHSRETVRTYPESEKGFNQAINVRRSGTDQDVDGEDIIIPAMRMSYRIRNPVGVLNEAFARKIFNITACVNNDTWHGFSPGELLFLGGDGIDGTVAEAEMVYHFAAESNLREQIIGSIEGIEKAGHDLLWVFWVNDEADGYPVKKPQSVHVERVYNRIKFAEHFTF